MSCVTHHHACECIEKTRREDNAKLLAEIDALRAENELVRDKLLAMAQEHAVWEKHSLCEIVKERDRLRETLEKIYPALPSYLGQSETPDNPCYRRIADEALHSGNRAQAAKDE